MIPPGKYRGCKRNISKTPCVYETDGCTLYSPQDKHPELCSRCNYNVIHHHSESDQVNPTTVRTTGVAGTGSSGAPGTCNQVEGELRILMVPAIELNGAPRASLVRPRFTKTQTNAMREYVEHLGWSVSSVRGSTSGQAELNNLCVAHGITSKKFADWVSKNKKNATNVYSWEGFCGNSSSRELIN